MSDRRPEDFVTDSGIDADVRCPHCAGKGGHWLPCRKASPLLARDLEATREARDSYKRAWQRDLAKGREFLTERDALAASLRVAREGLEAALRLWQWNALLKPGILVEAIATAVRALEAPALAAPTPPVPPATPIDDAGKCPHGYRYEDCCWAGAAPIAVPVPDDEHRSDPPWGICYCRKCISPAPATPIPAPRDGRPMCKPWCGVRSSDMPRLTGDYMTALPADNRLHSFCTSECMLAGHPLHPAAAPCGRCGGKREVPMRNLADERVQRPCPDCSSKPGGGET